MQNNQETYVHDSNEINNKLYGDTKKIQSDSTSMISDSSDGNYSENMTEGSGSEYGAFSAHSKKIVIMHLTYICKSYRDPD